MLRGSSVLRLVAVAAAAALALAHAAESAADIDVEFLQDGHTTYCQGVREDEGSLVFEHMKVTSAGKCPITVAIDLSQKTLPTIASPLSVTWAAKLAPIDVAKSLFPHSVDAATGKPYDVIASLLRACKVGSNCADEGKIVVPAATSSELDSVGAFDDAGAKTLQSYQFQFPEKGEYVVVGKVVLPGDAALNISATEFVTMQTVQVGVEAASGDAVGTVKPAEESNATPAPTETPTTKPNIDVNAEAAEGAALKGSASKNLLLLAVIGGVGAIGIVAAFAISRRQARSGSHNTLGFHDETMKGGGSIYRLDDAHSAAPQTAAPPRRKNFKKMQTRYYEQDSLPPQDAPIHTVAATAHRTFGHSEEEVKYNDDEPLDPFAQSGATMLNSLHDSAVRMPRRVRPSASSTLYTDSIGGASEASRLSEVDLGMHQSEATLAPMRPTDMTDLSEYDGHGLDQSTYSWVYSQSEADLATFHLPARSTNV